MFWEEVVVPVVLVETEIIIVKCVGNLYAGLLLMTLRLDKVRVVELGVVIVVDLLAIVEK